MTEGLLPVSRFSNMSAPMNEQFNAWRAGNVAMFDFFPSTPALPAAFPAEATTYMLGPLAVGRTRYPGHRYTRDTRKIGQGLDVFLVRLYLAGGHSGTNGREAVESGTGDIDVLDMTQPMAYDSLDSTLIVVGIPRPLMVAAIPDAARLHGWTLSGDRALGALLADYLRSLIERLSLMTQNEADAVAGATLAIVTSCLRGSHDAMAAGDRWVSSPLLAPIKLYIEENLASSDLTPDVLCVTFGLSRASLYRLFAPLGGVKRFIRDRRLVRAFVSLADPSQRHRPIAEIAADRGFSSMAQFSRAFRRAFGCAPRQTRELSQVDEASSIQTSPDKPEKHPEYIEWLRKLALRDR